MADEMQRRREMFGSYITVNVLYLEVFAPSRLSSFSTAGENAAHAAGRPDATPARPGNDKDIATWFTCPCIAIPWP